MNELNWIREIHWQDQSFPNTPLGEAEVFTLYLSDFLQMPEVDYLALAHLDPEIRALLN